MLKRERECDSADRIVLKRERECDSDPSKRVTIQSKSLWRFNTIVLEKSKSLFCLGHFQYEKVPERARARDSAGGIAPKCEREYDSDL